MNQETLWFHHHNRGVKKKKMLKPATGKPPILRFQGLFSWIKGSPRPLANKQLPCPLEAGKNDDQPIQNGSDLANAPWDLSQ